MRTAIDRWIRLKVLAAYCDVDDILKVIVDHTEEM